MYNRALLALISGASLTVAFAPFDWIFLAWLSPAIWLYTLLRTPPKIALYYGFLFGIGLFSTGVSWIYHSVHQFGNATAALSGLITALFVIMLALYPAVQAYCFRKFFQNKSITTQCLLGFPLTWVFLELLRSALWTGFPWLLLGYTQTTTPFHSYAPIISVFGVSLITATISACLVLFICRPIAKKVYALIVMILITSGAILLQHLQWSTPVGKAMTVALLQGNILPSLKWDETTLPHILTIYKTETQKHWSNQLILWPEASIPIAPSQISDWIEALHQDTLQHNSAIILGIPLDYDHKAYNSIITLGHAHGHYNKRHLVPFGEYTPLSSIFYPLMKTLQIPYSNLTPGQSQQAPLTAQNIAIAPFICYEIAYPFSVAHYAQGKALIVVLNDDSWFGLSAASDQQWQMAQMRAIELSRDLLYVSNTGVTGIVNAHGQITQVAPKYQHTTLLGTAQPRAGSTPLSVFSHWPLTLLLIILSLACVFCP